jgi:hypothetical protein
MSNRKAGSSVLWRLGYLFAIADVCLATDLLTQSPDAMAKLRLLCLHGAGCNDKVSTVATPLLCHCLLRHVARRSSETSSPPWHAPSSRMVELTSTA